MANESKTEFDYCKVWAIPTHLYGMQITIKPHNFSRFGEVMTSSYGKTIYEKIKAERIKPYGIRKHLGDICWIFHEGEDRDQITIGTDLSSLSPLSQRPELIGIVRVSRLKSFQSRIFGVSSRKWSATRRAFPKDFGKIFLNWVARSLIENSCLEWGKADEFVLNDNDPNTYGGLLWRSTVDAHRLRFMRRCWRQLEDKRFRVQEARLRKELEHRDYPGCAHYHDKLHPRPLPDPTPSVHLIHSSRRPPSRDARSGNEPPPPGSHHKPPGSLHPDQPLPGPPPAEAPPRSRRGSQAPTNSRGEVRALVRVPESSVGSRRSYGSLVTPTRSQRTPQGSVSPRGQDRSHTRTHQSRSRRPRSLPTSLDHVHDLPATDTNVERPERHRRRSTRVPRDQQTHHTNDPVLSWLSQTSSPTASTNRSDRWNRSANDNAKAWNREHNRDGPSEDDIRDHSSSHDGYRADRSAGPGLHRRKRNDSESGIPLDTTQNGKRYDPKKYHPKGRRVQGSYTDSDTTSDTSSDWEGDSGLGSESSFGSHSSDASATQSEHSKHHWGPPHVNPKRGEHMIRERKQYTYKTDSVTGRRVLEQKTYEKKYIYRKRRYSR